MKKTVCLNMIVKNESHVIERCLASVKPFIDYWVIVDTGSTDGTQEKIKQFFRNVPGKLYEREWVNFGYNRKEAMDLAKDTADYLLFIDADDRLVFSPDFRFPEELDADVYSIYQIDRNPVLSKKQDKFFMVKNSGEFEWEGVLHEYIKSKNSRKKKFVLIEGLVNEYINDGARSKNINKIEEDIKLLRRETLSNPEESRNYYYLARTYYSSKDYASALPCFEKRSTMGGDPIEVFDCLLYIGLIQRNLNYSPEVFLKSLVKSYLYRPSRIEPVFQIISNYIDKGDYLTGYAISRMVIGAPMSGDNLTLETWVYEWGVSLLFFICTTRLGLFDEAFPVLRELLSSATLPLQIRSQNKLDMWNDFFIKNSY